jgi:hypothetical protein
VAASAYLDIEACDRTQEKKPNEIISQDVQS